MAKRKFTLNEKARQQLKQAYELSQDIGARTRYQSVRLYGEGYTTPQIEEITGCRRSSLMGWCRKYQKNDVSELAATAQN